MIHRRVSNVRIQSRHGHDGVVWNSLLNLLNLILFLFELWFHVIDVEDRDLDIGGISEGSVPGLDSQEVFPDVLVIQGLVYTNVTGLLLNFESFTDITRTNNPTSLAPSRGARSTASHRWHHGISTWVLQRWGENLSAVIKKEVGGIMELMEDLQKMYTPEQNQDPHTNKSSILGIHIITR